MLVGVLFSGREKKWAQKFPGMDGIPGNENVTR
jgi:hypothetical protein